MHFSIGRCQKETRRINGEIDQRKTDILVLWTMKDICLIMFAVSESLTLELGSGRLRWIWFEAATPWHELYRERDYAPKSTSSLADTSAAKILLD